MKLKDRLNQGLLYIGRRPTFDGEERSFEVYILDFAGELYGEELEIYLLRKLRGDQQFDNLEKLQRQIERDVRAAREFFLEEGAGGQAVRSPSGAVDLQLNLRWATIAKDADPGD
ncbi:MAG: riboflavin kinase [Candidatus Bipolaricaulia bacterium]